MEVETPHLRMKLSEQIGFAEKADYHIVKEVTSRFYRTQQTIVTVASANSTVVTGAPMMLNVPNSYGCRRLRRRVVLRRRAGGRNGLILKVKTISV